MAKVRVQARNAINTITISLHEFIGPNSLTQCQPRSGTSIHYGQGACPPKVWTGGDANNFLPSEN